MKYCRARTYTSHTNPLQLHLLHGVLIYFDCIFVCVCVCASKGRTALVFDRLPSSNGRLVRLCLCSTGMASKEEKKKYFSFSGVGLNCLAFMSQPHFLLTLEIEYEREKKKKRR